MSGRLIRAVVLVFVLTQIGLYALMHIGVSVVDSRVPSFLCVVLCLAFAVFCARRDVFNQLVVFALVFTLCADYFLVLFNDYFFTAMIFFNIAQLFYAARVYLLGGNNRAVQIFTRAIAIVAVEVIAYLIAGDLFDGLVFVSVIYFCNLAVSAAFCLPHIKKQPLFAVGLLLFLCCDFCVWANNASGYMNMPQLFYILTSMNINIMWVFYAPSQVLLALSCRFGSIPTALPPYSPSVA